MLALRQFLPAVIASQKSILEKMDGVIIGHSSVHLSEKMRKRAYHFELRHGILSIGWQN